MIEEKSISDLHSSFYDSFDCGEAELNEFLIRYAKQNEKKGLGRTFVVFENDEVLGYYTLSSAQLAFAELPASFKKKYPRYPIPAIRLARFAVCKNHQANGIGKKILAMALKRIAAISLQAGVAFIVVDAKEHSKGFYEHFGFICLDKDKNEYIMPLETLIKAILG